MFKSHNVFTILRKSPPILERVESIRSHIGCTSWSYRSLCNEEFCRRTGMAHQACRLNEWNR
jgi:hypothetical protein